MQKKNNKNENSSKAADKVPVKVPVMNPAISMNNANPTSLEPNKNTLQNPPPPTETSTVPGEEGESDGKIVVKAVIGHFSSRWDTFIKGMEDDFKKFTKMLDDLTEGLVVRMKSVEKMVSEITDGKDGQKGLSETLQNFETRISSIEANNDDSPKEQTEQQSVITTEKLKEKDDKIKNLEKENS